MENRRHTKVEVTHDNAPTYISKEFLYGCTKTISMMYPHIKLIRYAPLAPCHGKTNLDRRFSSFTSWVTTFQFSQRIDSVETMCKVLNEGSKIANLVRREQGLEPIPTSANIFSLQPPPETRCIVELKYIKSTRCVTFIPKTSDRIKEDHTGFYINIFPWLSWRKGQPIQHKYVLEGETAIVLTAKQRTLREKLAVAGDLADTNFNHLKAQSDRRCKLLKHLKFHVKNALNPKF